jgi:hypothetical protein
MDRGDAAAQSEACKNQRKYGLQLGYLSKNGVTICKRIPFKREEGCREWSPPRRSAARGERKESEMRSCRMGTGEYAGWINARLR